MEVKQKLLQLARLAGGSLLDIDGAPLTIEASAEHPTLSNHKQVDAQHIFFSRNEAARKELDRIIDRQKPLTTILDDPTPQRNHVFLAISLSYDTLEVSLKLHPDAWVDRQNLEHKVSDHYAAEKLVDLLNALPSSFSIGISPEKVGIHEANEGARLEIQSLRKLMKQLPPPSAESNAMSLPGTSRLFCISHSLPRESVLRFSEGSTEAIVDWLKQSLAQLLPLYQAIAWSRKNDHVLVKEALEQEKVTQRQKGIGKSDKVRVIRGLWAGKSGIVQEIDTKGQLRIVIGKMAVKIDVGDVEKVD